MTAVEYLFETLWDCPKDKLTWYTILEQAKEMEKQQIIDAVEDCRYGNGNEYYNDTYGSKGSNSTLNSSLNSTLNSSSQIEISDEDIEKFINSFPYTKHLDDGQYNDGVIVGAELGIEWYREQLKKK